MPVGGGAFVKQGGVSYRAAVVWRSVRSVFSWVLMLGACAFIVHMIRPQLELLPQVLHSIDWRLLAIAVVISVPMYICQALYHVKTLARFSDKPVDAGKSMSVYLQAQVVRYLPGKIWGLLYQSGKMSGELGAGIIVAANLWQTLITNMFAAVITLSVLLAVWLGSWWLSLILLAVLGLEWLHRRPLPAGLRHSRVRAGLLRVGVVLPDAPLSPWLWGGTAMLCFEWVFFFGVFACLLAGHHGWVDALVLGAWYSGASTLSLAAFVVPAGLAVREAIFMGAPAVVRVDAGHLLVIAALMRLVFIAAEIVCAFLSVAIRKVFKDE